MMHNPSNPQRSIEVRILFDSGSQKSYITERAKSLLALESTGEQLLSIATFGSSKVQEKVCAIVNAGLCLRGYPPMSMFLYVVPTICDPLVCQPIATCIKKSTQFKGLEFADYSDGKTSLRVDVLVGSDYYWELVTGSVCRSDCGPAAIHTKLGWVLSGPMPEGNNRQCSTHLVTTQVFRVDAKQQETISLDEQLRSFWELEALGIQGVEKTLYDDFTSSITFSQGRYKVTLPWKEFHDSLPDHYQLSLKRLNGLLRILRQEPAILERYNHTIQDQLANGIIETVDCSESTFSKVHYLPHHPVMRMDKTTTKLRVVYDALA